MSIRLMVWQCDRCGEYAREVTGIGGYEESVEVCDLCLESFRRWKTGVVPGEQLSSSATPEIRTRLSDLDFLLGPDPDV